MRASPVSYYANQLLTTREERSLPPNTSQEMRKKMWCWWCVCVPNWYVSSYFTICHLVFSWYLFSYLFFHVIFFVTLNTDPIICPLTYTAYVGQTSVTFYCSSNAISVFWSINGSDLTTQYLNDHGIEIVANCTPAFKSCLTISTFENNTNTRIQCGRHMQILVNADDVPLMESKNATFYVQGQLVVLTDSC